MSWSRTQGSADLESSTLPLRHCAALLRQGFLSLKTQHGPCHLKTSLQGLQPGTGFIQARLCKIQGLFMDFSKTFLLFSRTENFRKILMYTLNSTSEMLSPLLKICKIISIKLWCLYLVQHMLHQIRHHKFILISVSKNTVESSCKW